MLRCHFSLEKSRIEHRENDISESIVEIVF